MQAPASAPSARTSLLPQNLFQEVAASLPLFVPGGKAAPPMTTTRAQRG